MNPCQKIRHSNRYWDETYLQNLHKYAVYRGCVGCVDSAKYLLYIGGADSLDDCHLLLNRKQRKFNDGDCYYIVESSQGGFVSFHRLCDEFGHVKIGFLGMRKFLKEDYFTDDMSNPFVNGCADNRLCEMTRL